MGGVPIFKIFLILLSVLSFSGDVFSAPPVLVEFFGKNACVEDTDVQDALQDILKMADDIILLNCRTWHDGEKEVKTFSHRFCNARQKFYHEKFKVFGFSLAPSVVVNGRWEAYHKNIKPALALARKDDIRSISLRVHHDALDVSLPDISSNTRSGDILLYAYMPTQGAEIVSVRSEIETQGDGVGQQNVPFVTKIEKTPFYLRPVLAMEKIGQWHGEPINLTVPLRDISSFSGLNISHLGYVVVLHGKDSAGPVLAVGETISMKELSYTLPHSSPPGATVSATALQ